jgi:hypothetical protein
MKGTVTSLKLTLKLSLYFWYLFIFSLLGIWESEIHRGDEIKDSIANQIAMKQ